MITPTKYLDLKTSVLNVTTVIIEALLRAGSVTLNELDEAVSGRIGDGARANFLPALSFLYLLGKLDYDIALDVVSLREAI